MRSYTIQTELYIYIYYWSFYIDQLLLSIFLPSVLAYYEKGATAMSPSLGRKRIRHFEQNEQAPL